MSAYLSYIEAMEYLKYESPSIEMVFGTNFISKHCSEFPKFLKTYLFLKLILFLVCKFTCQICERTPLFQYSIYSSDWNLSF
jgi:hypothetical protein